MLMLIRLQWLYVMCVRRLRMKRKRGVVREASMRAEDLYAEGTEESNYRGVRLALH